MNFNKRERRGILGNGSKPTAYDVRRSNPSYIGDLLTGSCGWSLLVTKVHFKIVHSVYTDQGDYFVLEMNTEHGITTCKVKTDPEGYVIEYSLTKGRLKRTEPLTKHRDDGGYFDN